MELVYILLQSITTFSKKNAQSNPSNYFNVEIKNEETNVVETKNGQVISVIDLKAPAAELDEIIKV